MLPALPWGKTKKGRKKVTDSGLCGILCKSQRVLFCVRVVLNFILLKSLTNTSYEASLGQAFLVVGPTMPVIKVLMMLLSLVVIQTFEFF